MGLDADDKKKVVVVASGRCGVAKMTKHLAADAPLFGALRVYAVEAAVKQPKFISFYWAGKAAPLRTKVAANNIKAAVMKCFDVRRRGQRGGRWVYAWRVFMWWRW